MTLLTLRAVERDGLTQVEVLRPDRRVWERVEDTGSPRCYCGEHDGAHMATTTPTTKAEQ